MKKKPDTSRTQKGEKQVISARRPVKDKEDFFSSLYENSNPVTLPKIPKSHQLETSKNPNDNTNDFNSNQNITNDANSNSQFMGISKVKRSKDKYSKPMQASFKVNTKGLAAIKKDSSQHRAQTIQSPKKVPSDLAIQTTPPRQHPRPRTPTSSLMSTDLTNKSPKLFIPNLSNTKSSNSSSQHHALSARPSKQPILPHTPIDSLSTISNDKLALFDDNDFDDPEFMQKIRSRITQGTVTGSSLYFTSEGTFEWMPCTVLSFIPPNNYKIRFNISGKVKEVPRISLRFDDEDKDRFEKRREKAKITRTEIDSQLKQETYLMSRSERINIPIEPTLIKSMLKRLSEKEKSHFLIPRMLIEIQNQYSYSLAVVDYINLWETNEEAKIDFIKNGLRPINFASNETTKVPRVRPLKMPNIFFPNYKSMLEIVDLLKDIENDPFFSYVNKKSTSLVDFFNDFKFHLKTASSNARSIVLNQLIEISQRIIEKVTDESKKKSLLCMINLRYKHALSNLTIRSIDHIIESGMHFNIVSENDPQKVDQPLDDIISKGNGFIDEVYKTFIENPPQEVDPYLLTNKSLSLDNASLDKRHEEALKKWDEIVRGNFNDYQKMIDDINEITIGIPRDLNKKLKEILPDDFTSVLNEGKDPSVDSNSINYEAIQKDLELANQGLKNFHLKYTNCFFQFKLFTFDATKFFDKISQMHSIFKDSVFQYLTSHSNYQLNRISEMITSLDSKCRKKAEDIEQWYEKSTLLLDVATNFKSLNKMLDQVFILLTFMSNFYYEPKENGFVKLYQVRLQLSNAIKSLEKYKKQDIDEKIHFIEEHSRRKKELQKELQSFQVEVSNFHNQDPTKDVQYVNEILIHKEKEFNELKKTVQLYQKRDEAIGVEKTEYPIVATIQGDIDMFLHVWNIAVLLETEVPKWLSTQYRELNVNLISDTLIEWERTLKKIVSQLGVNHKMAPMLNKLIQEVTDQIPHLQIVRAFCNPNLRSRHWNQISKLVQQEINPNESITWHWMLESGVEDYIIGINAISRSADLEYKVEKTLYTIIEDLTSLKLKVNEVDGVVRLEDPTYAVEMLAEHQRMIQEVMIPPYINPFLSKIKDYEVLSSNVRSILKTTLDTQQRIDELKPAMDSKDLRVQHEDVCLQFDEQVEKFNNFTGNFKLSLSFHQIVSNQKYVDLTKDLFNEFEVLKKDLTEILEEKRKQFPRFYLLSDSQLVYILSTCQTPSKSNHLFNIMYPAISHALFNDKETECIGFVSIYNETLMLNNKVKVNPEKVEKWYSQFDIEIVNSMRESTKTLLSKRSGKSEKLALQYPIQIVQVVNNIMFTTNVENCFDRNGSSFAENRVSRMNDQFELILNSLNESFEFLKQAYMKQPCIQLSALILSFINNRNTIKKLIKKKVDSPFNSIWYSNLKYHSISDPSFDVIVRIGPSSYNYGFEFGLSRYPFPQTKMSSIMNASLMLSTASRIPTVVCSRIGISNIETLINFTTLLGKMPIILNCTNYVNFDRIKKTLDISEKVNSFIIFNGLDHLSQETFNELSIEVLKRKETIPHSMRIFGTYSIVSECPEKLKLAYRPIVLKDIDAEKQFRTLLSSCITQEEEYVNNLSSKLGSFIINIAPAFFSKFNFINPMRIIWSAVLNTFEKVTNKMKINEINYEIYKSISEEFKKYYGEYEQFNQLQTVMDTIFEIKSSDQKSSQNQKLKENGKLNDLEYRISQLEEFIQSHFAIVLLGKPLCGKTVSLNQAIENLELKVEYINQHSIDPSDLYGNVNSGLISSLISTTDVFVFDGVLKNGELETVVSGFEIPHYFTFGDSTRYIMNKKHRFIFETDDISNASPALIGNCPIFFINDHLLSFGDRLNFFLEKKIRNESRLIDPFSQTIVGSRISCNDLCEKIADFSTFIIPKMKVENDAPLTELHCISGYFKFLQCSILNYYVTGNMKANLKNTAENLIQDIPDLCLFSVFWAFAAAYNDEQLSEFDKNLRKLYHSKYGKKIDSIIESYFDSKKRVWMKWTDSGSELFPIQSKEEGINIYQYMTDISPQYLLIPLVFLTPTLYLTNILISEGYNVLISGTRNSSINNLIISTPNISENFTPYSFSFPPEGTHKIIRKMIHMILPDSSSSHGFTVRKPLLSLYDFDPNSSASELMRFVIEHGYMHNDVSFVRNIVDGIRFVVSCRETEIFNQRLTHHMFVIRIPKPSDNIIQSTISHAINVLWNIQDNNDVISSSLLKLFRESQNVFHFNIEHLLTVLQRVAIVRLNKDPSFLLEAIAHETVAIFYNAFHSKDILNSIQNAISTISKKCSFNYIDVNEIAGKKLLTNLHSDVFRSVSSFDDLNKNTEKSLKKENSLMKFISYENSFSELKINEEMIKKIKNKIKQFDIMSISSYLSTPRTHLTINSSGLSKTNMKLVTYACEIIQAELHHKRLNEPLMKCFHDQFINGGIKKKHHVLFLTDLTLTSNEKLMLKQLVNSSDVFDLFERGEKLQLMTDMFSSGHNPFDDETCETMDGYNRLLSNFLTDCSNYFHLCVVTDDKDVLRHSLIYKPFYGIDHALSHLINSINIDGRLQEKIESLHNIQLFSLYPYLLKYPNMKFFIKSLKNRMDKWSEKLKSRKLIIDQIASTGEDLKVFMDKTSQEMEDLKNLLVSLSEELENSSKQTEQMSSIAQLNAEKFEKQSKVLNEQEIAADKLRKESQKQLTETKAILENASKELKALSSRDLAIIKTMNHPPHGVVLVVSAMCIVLDQPIDRTKEDEVVWNSAKKVLNDASFMNKLVSKALDSLTPTVLEQLKQIIADPNFDPKVIQRASSAAKSICTFIRSVVPYYEALEVYKLRAKEVDESQKQLNELRRQHEIAMNALAQSKQDVINMQNKQLELQERKKQIENQLFEQSQKIDSYQKVEELMKPFFNQNKIEQKNLEKNINDLFDHCFLQQLVIDLFGPFNNDERNQIAKALTPKIGRYTYLPYEDDDLVERWESLHYPVSLMMKENTLMLSSRWVAALGIRNVPDSFLKQVLNKNVICSLSILSPNFEENFIFSIKRNQGIIIYDYDFSNPHPLVMLAFEAQQENGPLFYTSNSNSNSVEMINIPDNFVCYFNVDKLIPNELVNPLPPCRFVNLSIDATTTTEMIALRLFNLTSLRQKNEAAQIEREILLIKENLANSEAALRTLLVDSSTKIFSDKNMQWNFTNLARKRNELIQSQKKLKQQHLWLFDDYPTLTLLAKNLNEFFLPYTKQSSLLWSVFEAEFEDVKRISTDSLCHIAQTQIIGIFSAALPLVERIKTCAEAFHLKLDGSNSFPSGYEDPRTIHLSRSDDRLYMSSMMLNMSGIDDDDNDIGDDRNELNEDDENSAVGIRLSRSNDDFSKDLNLTDSTGFDRLINKLNEVTEGQIRDLQYVPNILKRTHPNRPVLIHTITASYQLLAFLYIFKCEMIHVGDILSRPTLIQNAAQKGSVVVTVCCNKKTLCELLSAVSMVTASGFLSANFRLICFVIEISFGEMMSISSLFVSKCDVICLDSPLSVKTVFSSTIKSLTCDGLFTRKVSIPTSQRKRNGRPIISKSDTDTTSQPLPMPTIPTKYDPFAAKMALFDAAVVSTHLLSHLAKCPSFFAFRAALQCSYEANNGNINEIGEFAIKYVYGADSELSGCTRPLFKIWSKFDTSTFGLESSPTSSPSKFISSQYPLPTSFAERNVQKSLDSMPVLDDPLVFGFESYAFDFFKDHFFDSLSGRNATSSSASSPEIPADSVGNLNLLLNTSSTANSPSIKKSLKKLNVANVDASRVSSMTSLMTVMNSLNKGSSDFLTFEIKLDLIAQPSHHNLLRREQLIRAPKIIDISLLYQPLLMIDSIISQDFLELKKFGRVVAVKDANKYAVSQPVHQRLFFNDLFCRGASFDSNSAVFRKFNGFSKLPPLEFYVTEKVESLRPARLFHNGKMLMTIYAQKDNDDFEFSIFSYSKKE